MDFAEKGRVSQHAAPPARAKWRTYAFWAAFVIACQLASWLVVTSTSSHSLTTSFDSLHYTRLCPNLTFIDKSEFTTRRHELGRLLLRSDEPALDDEGDEKTSWGAYVTEPSPNSLYYLNISTTDWFLSERPWLAVVTPVVGPNSDASEEDSTGTPRSSSSHLSILTPAFELSRTQRLPFAVSKEDFAEVSWVPWQEAENPYEVLLDHLANLREGQKARGSWTIHLEENTRQFVASGLSDAAQRLRGIVPKVQLASLKIREQRMRKTEAELALQRCVGKVTVHALRMLQRRLKVGMTEKDGEKLITEALTAGGLSHLDALVLFGANAALPHASASVDKRLQEGEFALFDVGGNLGGYQSDFTRTMLPNGRRRRGGWTRRLKDGLRLMLPSVRFREAKGREEWPNERSKEIWMTVKEAQKAALSALATDHLAVSEREGPSAASVDKAARDVIERRGYGRYFTHRLGHGIGLQVHEHPYLDSGNRQTLLPGETFSNEPGIYIEKGADKNGQGVGVRLEDMVLRTERGWELVSGEPLAASPWSP